MKVKNSGERKTRIRPSVFMYADEGTVAMEAEKGIDTRVIPVQVQNRAAFTGRQNLQSGTMACLEEVCGL
jgi:hypothetical protein